MHTSYLLYWMQITINLTTFHSSTVITNSPQMLILPDALVLAVRHPQNCVYVRGIVLDQLLDVLLYGQRVHLLERFIGPVAKVLRRRTVMLLVIAYPLANMHSYLEFCAREVSSLDLTFSFGHLHFGLSV